MSLGVVGSISVAANLIPREWKEFITCLTHQDLAKAKILHRKYFSLCKALFIETNPQGVKYALSTMGKCLPHLRLPLLEPQEMTKRMIEAELQILGVKKEENLSIFTSPGATSLLSI
jgi:4-hydroxy-tetrahydrodipicolinate synthase